MMKRAPDINTIKKENSLLKKELIQRTKELAFLINSGKALTSTLDFNKVLRIIIERAQRLIKCRTWSLLLVNSNDDNLRFVATKKGRNTKAIKRFNVKSGQGIAGWVAKNSRSVIIDDVRKDRRFKKSVDQLSTFKTRSILCVPIINKKRVVGVLELINKNNGAPFEEKEKQLLTQLVDQAAIALERSHLYQQMANLAITDDLTKLFNFRHLDQTLDREMTRCQRYGSPLSVIFFDMDYFKYVNDSHGHLMGSRVLVEVAEILLKSLRSVDIIARYGGDEFVVVLPETSVKTAKRIAKRLHRTIQAHKFLTEDGVPFQMTASFGISGFPEHAETKRELIRLSDQAMYRAKNSGRNQICVANATRRHKRLRGSSSVKAS